MLYSHTQHSYTDSVVAALLAALLGTVTGFIIATTADAVTILLSSGGELDKHISIYNEPPGGEDCVTGFIVMRVLDSD